MRRRIAAALTGVLASFLLASTALASHCVNASKPDQSAGAQIILNLVTGEIEWTTEGVTTRIEQGLIDPANGEGFHGILGLDFNGDGLVDVSTWFGVGPEQHAIPDQAIGNGPACQGITDIGTFLSQCLGG
jgi:hypothetical protein